MKVKCPENPEHKQFVTTAHVMQDWFVDENGNFVAVATECVEVTHRPDPDNVWTCLVCGAEAIVER